MKWNPFTLDEVKEILPKTDTWFVDGGESLDLFLGRKTRTHEDLDIGILSTDVKWILNTLVSEGFEVLIANRNLSKLDLENIDISDYNYWVSDGSSYKLQVLVYRVDGNDVYFRRNAEIRWPLSNFILEKEGVRIINPLVAYAFKVTTSGPEVKDLQDISELTGWLYLNG